MPAAAVASPDLARIMADDPGALFETVAKEHGVTVRATIKALPESMRRFAPGSTFVEIMNDIAGWGEVTLIIHTDDGVMQTPFVPAQAGIQGLFCQLRACDSGSPLSRGRTGAIV